MLRIHVKGVKCPGGNNDFTSATGMGEAIRGIRYLGYTLKVSRGWDDKKRRSKGRVQSEKDMEKKKIRDSLGTADDSGGGNMVCGYW